MKKKSRFHLAEKKETKNDIFFLNDQLTNQINLIISTQI